VRAEEAVRESRVQIAYRVQDVAPTVELPRLEYVTPREDHMQVGYDMQDVLPPALFGNRHFVPLHRAVRWGSWTPLSPKTAIDKLADLVR